MRRKPKKKSRLKAWTSGGVIALLALLTQGCSYHSAFIRYDEYTDVTLQAESFSGDDLGVVTITEGGAIWKECTDVARGAIWLLIDEARRRGGNAVGDIRWMPRASDRRIDRPTCKRRWGFFLIWPVLATPAFMAANVEGVVYRTDSASNESAGLYRLPDGADETSRLVEAILVDTGIVSPVRQMTATSGGR
jgi:hypothetical protein